MNRVSLTIRWVGIILFWVCVGMGALVASMFWLSETVFQSNIPAALTITGGGIVFGTLAYVFCRALAYTFSDEE